MSESPDALASPLLRQRASYPHWVVERVRWSDTDMASHANNLAFAAWAESGRALLLRSFLQNDSATPALLVLAEMRLKYLGEAHWPADIEVGTCVSTVGTRSCRMAQGLFAGERCIGLAESVLVLIDIATRKSRDIPAAMREALLAWSPRAPDDASAHTSQQVDA